MSQAAETVAVLSDTHLHGASPQLLARLDEIFEDCTRLLHAGDIVSRAALDLLATRFRVEAVRGNMDVDPGLRGLPRKRIVQVGGLDVGLCHGEGAPASIEGHLLEQFAPRPPRVIVFGHTHRATDRVVEGIRLCNPGSPTDPRNAPLCSVARLTVDSDGAIAFDVIPV